MMAMSLTRAVGPPVPVQRWHAALACMDLCGCNWASMYTHNVMLWGSSFLLCTVLSWASPKHNTVRPQIVQIQQRHR
jgi:hypothetical protein